RRGRSVPVARRARARRLAEDERLAWHARERAHSPAVELHGGTTRRARILARDRAAGANDRNVEVVEGGASRRLPRLQPEREGPDHLLGVLRAAAARRAGLGAARVGRDPGL